MEMITDVLMEIADILIVLTVGISAGLLSGMWVKKNYKLKQDKIYEKNRKMIIKTLLYEIYVPFHQLPNIFQLFERQENFDPGKDFSHSFSDNELYAIQDYAKDVSKRIENLPNFHDCSTFVAYNEYLAIKKYLMSAIFFYPIDGSMVNKKNLVGYNPKFMIDHALFAKDIIEYFQDYGLSRKFIDRWTTILQNEGMLDPNYEKKPLEPGDIVPRYIFDSELLGEK